MFEVLGSVCKYLFEKIGLPLMELKINEKQELKKIDLKLEEERRRKELNKSDKEKLEDFCKLLYQLDVLRNSSHLAKNGTGILLKTTGGTKKEIQKLSKNDILYFTEVVTTFKEDFFEWKKLHYQIFLGFGTEARDAFYKMENYFSQNRKQYSEHDFIKLYQQKNNLLKELKKELSK